MDAEDVVKFNAFLQRLEEVGVNRDFAYSP
jgi:hypothetical protein